MLPSNACLPGYQHSSFSHVKPGTYIYFDVLHILVFLCRGWEVLTGCLIFGQFTTKLLPCLCLSNALHNCTAACRLIHALQTCQHKDWLCLNNTQTACRFRQPSEALPTPLHLSCLCRSGQSEGLPYGEKCLFVANDWHAALVPSFLAAKYRRNGVYTHARSIVAIHNMSHQGVEPSSFFGRLGLPSDW